MDGDGLAMPTDFMQDLDLWLQDGGLASPANFPRTVEHLPQTASILSPQGGLFTPQTASTGPEKANPSSFVDALLQDAQTLLGQSVTPPVVGTATRKQDKGQKQQKRSETAAKQSAARPKGRPPSTQEPQKKKSKTNKSTSQRQKEELAYLRSKSEHLETELETLKQKQRVEFERQQHQEQNQSNRVGEMTTELVTRSLDATFTPAQQEVSLWERIAKRQREEKAKSEVENAKLREMVQSQMRLVKSFERLLRKRRIWDQLQEKSSNQKALDGRSQEQLQEEMLADVNARYPRVDVCLEEHGLGDADPMLDGSEDTAMKYSPTDGMYIEFKEKRYMPFNYKTMDDVVWRSFGEGKLKMEGADVEILQHTDDVAFIRTNTPLPDKSGCSKEAKCAENFEMISMMKRFQEQDRVVYVWQACVSVQNPEPGSSATLVQKGCATAASATLPDGSLGCFVRSYTRSSPDVSCQSAEEEQAQHRQVGMLTELVFSAYKHSRQSISQTVENLLLDEMMAKNSSGTATPATSSAETDSP